MKKILLLIALPFVFIATLTAQIAQEQADDIVITRMSDEAKPHNIFAKDEVQMDGFSVVTSTGETLELEYSCLVYYVKFNVSANGKYLIVKESNGNLLEVNTKNDTGPDDLEEWRTVLPKEIPFTEYSLDGTSCQWVNLNSDESVIIINSNEELENYIHCTEGSYPEIDFSKHTLLLANGKSNSDIYEIIVKKLLQLSINKYELNLGLFINDPATIDEKWVVAIIFVNNAIAIQIDPVAPTQSCSNKFEVSHFSIDDDFLGDPLNFETHIKLSGSRGVTIQGCTLVNNATLKGYDYGKNFGISAFNSPLILKEDCPCGLFDKVTGICTANCMKKNFFSGFNRAVSAGNSGTAPETKVRCSVFEDNLHGIYISGINNHELIRNEFNLTLSNSYGVSVNSATGYKIEENTFEGIQPAQNNSVGLAIINSGTAENEVYKNSFDSLYVAQNFLGNNAITFGSFPFPGLQTLCNTFNKSQYRDIHVGNFGQLSYLSNYIRKEQGSMQKSAGNQFNSTPIINIDNDKKSPHPIDYYCIKTQLGYPATVSNVSCIVANNANGCPSQIGIAGGSTKGGNPLDQYDEWNAEYEYWLAKAAEVCGEEGERRNEKGEKFLLLFEEKVSDGGKSSSDGRGKNDECAVILDKVSYYSALKDNYFNWIIVNAMGDEMMKRLDDETMNGEGDDSYGLMVLRSSGLEIYPNPGKDYITVVSEEENCLFELIDATGRIQKSIKLDIGNNTINISSLQKGFYVFKVVVRGKIVTGKWIKE